MYIRINSFLNLLRAVQCAMKQYHIFKLAHLPANIFQEGKVIEPDQKWNGICKPGLICQNKSTTETSTVSSGTSHKMF